MAKGRKVRVSRFFFQAEDGIRDLTVTGVQTCALPIFNPPVQITANAVEQRDDQSGTFLATCACEGNMHVIGVWIRSEERRVGKECRSRLLEEHEKKNNQILLIKCINFEQNR